jgi:hypothetical protein
VLTHEGREGHLTAVHDLGARRPREVTTRGAPASAEVAVLGEAKAAVETVDSLQFRGGHREVARGCETGLVTAGEVLVHSVQQDVARHGVGVLRQAVHGASRHARGASATQLGVQRAKPPRRWPAVVVGEGDHFPARRVDAPVARRRRPDALAHDDPHVIGQRR